MRTLLLLLLALLPLPTLAQTVTFAPRESAPQAGLRVVEESTWTTTGYNEVRVGGIPVKKGPVDRLSHHQAELVVEEAEGSRATRFTVAVREQVQRDDEEAEDLALDGVMVRAEGGPGDRRFERVDGARLKRSQRRWFEERYATEPEEGKDPLALLLPEGPVQVGASWDLSLDAVQEYFGARFTLDRAASHARTTLLAVEEHNGVPTGRFSYDVLIVPSAMENAEFDSAEMKLVGTAAIPVPGDQPWFSFDAAMDVRFLGVFKKGAIRAHADIAMTMHGKESRARP